MTKIAFDLGGVIIDRGDLVNQTIAQSFMSVKLAVQKFGSANIYVISKAKEKYIQRNVKLLEQCGFFASTGVLPENVYFVNSCEEKGIIGKLLRVNYILDDSIKVAKVTKNNGFECILFGQHNDFHVENPGFMRAATWKSFRKVMQRIPK